MKKRTEKLLIEWLDERYLIAQNAPEEHRTANINYYNGAIAALQFMCYWWLRNENGHHTIGKR